MGRLGRAGGQQRARGQGFLGSLTLSHSHSHWDWDWLSPAADPLLGPGTRSSSRGGSWHRDQPSPRRQLTSTIVSEANPGGAVVLFGTTAARKPLDSLASLHSPLMRAVLDRRAPYARSTWGRPAGWHYCHYWGALVTVMVDAQTPSDGQRGHQRAGLCARGTARPA